MTANVLKFLNKNRMEFGADLSEADAGHHWRLLRDDDNVAWLIFDCQDASVNTLNEAVLEELDKRLTEVERNPPRALVLRSAKTSGFCVGADIGMFRGLDDPMGAEQQLRRGHAIVDHLDAMPFTTIAVVHGACLGGGLELALACNYRIAADGAKLGFPEVLLGLHPGLGGTFRSTRLLNPVQAMTLMLTGKSLPAFLAKKQGLVDVVVPERHVQAAVAQVVAGKLHKAKRPGYSGLLAHSWLRPMIARKLTTETEKQVSQHHYPAPYNLINLWQQHGNDRKAMQEGEIQSFAALVSSLSGQNLIRVFFLRENLAKAGKAGDSRIKYVHVIGAGTMGGDIAAWCAFNGFPVTLGDRDNEMIAGAIKRAAELCKRKHKSRAETRDILDRLIPDVNGWGVPRADLVIEAVPEKLDIKRQVYRQLAPTMKPGAILATNTSSIPLEDLRGEVHDPNRFLGLHFFNPVSQMELVEVVVHEGVSQQTFTRANAFVGTLNRLPVPVKSAPGFLVNRVLTPYLMEALLLMDEGMNPDTVDKAAVDFGMPMGPAQLADQVGLDICVAVGDMLKEKLDTPLPEVPEWVREKVESGETGRKSGRGFYTWKDNQPQKGKVGEIPPETIDRLILPLLNACVACLREGVIKDPEVLDGAVIFGTGFAPFRGGPMHYVRERGLDSILSSMAQLRAEYGNRFEADVGWQELVSFWNR